MHLSEGTSVLSHVTVSAVGTQRVVLDRTGTPVYEFTLAEIPFPTPIDLYLAGKLAAILCTACGCRLIKWERHLCGPCEAEQVLDLVSLKGEFNGGLGQ